jgi:ceramide glucosyltransferase
MFLFFSFVIFAGYTFFTVKYRRGSKLLDIYGKPLPSVSILVTIKNIDDDMEKNFKSFFDLDYPDFEILFGVDSIEDPPVAILKALQARYPGVSNRIISTGHSSICNPKIHKLIHLAEEAVGELYWISDFNIRVKTDTLTKLVNAYLRSDSKLIFSPIRASGGRSIGSIIENSYINHFLSGNVIMAWKLFKQHIIVGKSILMEKKTLYRFGGFSYFKDYLAEDHMMGDTYIQSKIPISTNFTWVTNVNQTTTVKGFFSRMERWSKLRYHLKPHIYPLEVLMNPIMIALVSGLLLGGKNGWLIFAGTVLLKLFLEFTNFLLVNEEDRGNILVLLKLPFCILLKDLLLFIIYFIPFFSSTIQWRGGSRISIGKKTLIAFSQEDLLLDGV